MVGESLVNCNETGEYFVYDTYLNFKLEVGSFRKDTVMSKFLHNFTRRYFLVGIFIIIWLPLFGKHGRAVKRLKKSKFSVFIENVKLKPKVVSCMVIAKHVMHFSVE